jgi:hypothetical protein
MAHNIGINPTDVWAATAIPGFSVGTFGEDNLGREYVFMKADATGWTGAGYVCYIGAGTAGMITTTTTTPGTDSSQPVGIAQAAVAANGWGWLCVRGIGVNIRVAASCVKGTVLNTTATAGTIDDDATAGAEVIQGLCITTTNGGSPGNQPGNLIYPSVGRTL